MTRKSLAWLALAVLLLAAGITHALNVGEVVLKTVAVGAVVNAVAKPANDGINRLVGAGNAAGLATRVVPIVSVGEKGYVGAAQVAGSQALVNKTRAVLQFEQEFDNRQYRIKLLMPISSTNPLNAKRVRGVGITGLLDIGLSRNAYVVPPSEGFSTGDLLKAGAIAVATTQFGSQINSFINSVFRNQGSLPEGATRVVPYLSFGTKAYIGMIQVAGPEAKVAKVRAVWQYEQLFDRGRVRLRALVPSDSINPLSIHRVKGVGCTAIIDAMALRAREVERQPEHYRYFQSAPLFVGLGEDPRYRPPGWDRGRKVGWAKHGNPLLPPGLAKKQAPPVVIVPRVGAPARGRENPLPPGQARKRENRINRILEMLPGGAPEKEKEAPPPGEAKGHEKQERREAGPPPGRGRGKGHGRKGEHN